MAKYNTKNQPLAGVQDHDRPIFFDESGKRWILGSFILAISVITILSAAWITIFTQIHKIQTTKNQQVVLPLQANVSPRFQSLTIPVDEYSHYLSYRENYAIITTATLEQAILKDNILNIVENDISQSFQDFHALHDAKKPVYLGLTGAWNTIDELHTEEIQNQLLTYIQAHNYAGISVDSLFTYGLNNDQINSFISFFSSKNLKTQVSFDYNTLPNRTQDITASSILINTYSKVILHKTSSDIEVNNEVYLPDRTTLQNLTKNHNDSRIIWQLPTESLNRSYYDNILSWSYRTPYQDIHKLLPKTLELNSSGYYTDQTFTPPSIQTSLDYVDSITDYNQLISLNCFANNCPLALSNSGFADPTVFQIETKNQTQTQFALAEKWKVTDSILHSGTGPTSTLANPPQFGNRTLYYQDSYIRRSVLTKTPIQASIIHTNIGAGQINLSFDDGPDPATTPRILDILKANHIHATFFVIGAEVERFPELAKRIVAEGHTIGNHSFYHKKMYAYSSQAMSNEIQATQDIIEQSTGVVPTVFRSPYSDIDTAETDSELTGLAVLATHKMSLLSFDVDSNDWQQTNPNKITATLEKSLIDHQGHTILFHDGGGTRTQTIAALQTLITDLKTQNYTFVTPHANITAPQNFFTDNFISSSVVQSLFAFGVFGVIFVVLRSLILVSGWIYERYYRRPFVLKEFVNQTKYRPAVTVIIPCYKESITIVTTVNKLLENNYKKMKIIIIDDGSGDDTLTIAQEHFGQNKRVKILGYTKNQGKSYALNYGIAHSRSPIVICVDGDTIIHPDAISRSVGYFKNSRVAAVAGYVEIGNNDKHITRLQEVEYLFGQGFDKVGHQPWNAISVVPGAFGVWRRSVLKEIGGYKRDTLAEDTDITIKALLAGYEVMYEPTAICYTEAPENYKTLTKQRVRWQYGLLQIIAKNFTQIFRFKAISVSWFILPEWILSYLTAILQPVYGLLLLAVSAGFVYKLISSNASERLSILNLYLQQNAIWSILLFTSFGIIISLSIVQSHNRRRAAWLITLYLLPYLLVQTFFFMYVNTLAFTKVILGISQKWDKFVRTGSMNASPLASKI